VQSIAQHQKPAENIPMPTPRKKVSARIDAEQHFADDKALVLAMKPLASKCLWVLQRAVKTGKFDAIPPGWDEFKDIRAIVGSGPKWRDWLADNKRIMQIVDFNIEQLIDFHVDRVTGKVVINVGGRPNSTTVSNRRKKMKELIDQGKKPREIAEIMNLGRDIVRTDIRRIKKQPKT
jgi:hypothetical protein